MAEQVIIWFAKFDYAAKLAVESVEGTKTVKLIKFPPSSVTRFRSQIPIEDAFYSRAEALEALAQEVERERAHATRTLLRTTKELEAIAKAALQKKEPKKRAT